MLKFSSTNLQVQEKELQDYMMGIMLQIQQKIVTLRVFDNLDAQFRQLKARIN